jgi:ABC-type oligopeptide transport system ATPase subunit
MVKSKNYMTIIGEPGSGKTATARHIALQLERKGWEVFLQVNNSFDFFPIVVKIFSL